MPDQMAWTQETRTDRDSVNEISDGEIVRTRCRSLRKKARIASIRFSDTARKRGKPGVSQRCSPVLSHWERRKEEQNVARVFREVLVARDMLPPALDEYSLLLRILEAVGFDIEEAVDLWVEIIQRRKEHGIDFFLQDKLDSHVTGCSSSKSTDAFGQVRFSHLRNTVARDRPSSRKDVNLLEGSPANKRVPKMASQELLSCVTRSVVRFMVKLLAIIYVALSGIIRAPTVTCAKDAKESGGCSLEDKLASRDAKSNTTMQYLQRLKKLEVLVTELSKKPAQIPSEKDSMLSASLDRIKSIEYDLQKTKKVLHETASKQMELAESFETLKEIHPSGNNPQCDAPAVCLLENSGIPELNYSSKSAN